jgi:hypothetical protein
MVAVPCTWLVSACGSRGLSASPVPDGSAGAADGSASAADGGGEPSDAGATPSDGDSAFDAAPIPVANLCPVFTQDLCTYLMQCSGAPYRDLGHCEAELDCYGLPQLQAAAAEGGVIYDPSQVGACDARFRAAPCDFAFFLFTPDIFQVLSYCPGAIMPRLAAGAPCVSSSECVAGLYCKKGSGCPGVCTPYATVGESCAGGALCDPSLQCTSTTGGALTEVCAFVPEAGAPCTGSCGGTEYCPLSQTPCAQNLYCDSITSTCKPGRGLNEPCGPEGDGGPGAWQSVCASNLWCSQVFVDQPGTCLAAGGAGAPCNDIGCAQGLHCAGYVPLGPDAGLGQCIGLAPAGGSCKQSGDCEGGVYCGDGTCGGGRPLGSSCQQDTDCQAHMTCAGGKCAHAAYPGDSCDGTTSVCVLSLCRNGTCVDHAKVGQPCSMGSDCATGACYQGSCFDTSVCPVP